MCLITHNFGRGSFGYVGLQSGSLLAEYKRLKTTDLARALSVALLRCPPVKLYIKVIFFCVFLKAYQINQVTEEKVFDFLCVTV